MPADTELNPRRYC